MIQNISSVDWSQTLCLASSQVSRLTAEEETLNILISSWNLDLSPNPTSNTFQQPLTNALPLRCESFPTTHGCLSGAQSFHSQQHHSTHLLSVIATQLCGSSQLPALGSARVDMEAAAPWASQVVLKANSFCLLNKARLKSAKPSITTLLHRGSAPKRIITELQGEQPLFLSFGVFSLFFPFLLEEGTV